MIPGQRFRLVPFAGKLMGRQGMELEGIQPPPQVEGLAPAVEAGPRVPGPFDDVGHAAVPPGQDPLEEGLLGLVVAQGYRPVADLPLEAASLLAKLLYRVLPFPLKGGVIFCCVMLACGFVWAVRQPAWTMPLVLGVIAGGLVDLDNGLTGKLKNIVYTMCRYRL